jgi:hypothetical protein
MCHQRLCCQRVFWLARFRRRRIDKLYVRRSSLDVRAHARQRALHAQQAEARRARQATPGAERARPRRAQLATCYSI